MLVREKTEGVENPFNTCEFINRPCLCAAGAMREKGIGLKCYHTQGTEGSGSKSSCHANCEKTCLYTYQLVNDIEPESRKRRAWINWHASSFKSGV